MHEGTTIIWRDSDTQKYTSSQVLYNALLASCGFPVPDTSMKVVLCQWIVYYENACQPSAHDGVQVIAFYFPEHLPLALNLNCCKNCNN